MLATECIRKGVPRRTAEPLGKQWGGILSFGILLPDSLLPERLRFLLHPAIAAIAALSSSAANPPGAVHTLGSNINSS